MGRAKTPAFVCELPLVVTPTAARALLVRLDCARQVYNACLGEARQRLARMREAAEYQAARRLPKKTKERAAALAAARAQYGFREYALHAYAAQFSQSWLGEHLDANTIQKLATRAYLTAHRYAIGQSGKPRFKGKGQFDSLEGKTNKQGVLWREGRVKWSGLELPALIPENDAVIAHGLASPVKFVRLLRRKLNGRHRFYVQLVCEGRPFRKSKHAMGRGVVGLDLGPSTIAIVSEESATLERFCDELKPQQKVIRKLQRKLDRQRRANNPDHFNPDGTAQKGAREWRFSRRYVDTRAQLAELHRQQAAHRKSLHGQMVSRVLAQGNVIKLEKLSYRAFQRRFGKSVGFRGPGQFVSHLRRKAGNAGAAIDEFPTRPTRLSQICLCGTLAKKSLAERWHICDCGVGPVQRDLFSAWLARYVENERLDAGQAQAAWPSVDTRLRAASSVIQPAMGQGNPPNRHRVIDAGQSRSSAKSGEHFDEAHVFMRESISQPEPPGFSRGE